MSMVNVRRFLHNRGWHRFCRVATRTEPNPYYNMFIPLKDGTTLDVSVFGAGPTRTVTYHR